MIGSALGDAIGELAFHDSEKEKLEITIKACRELRYTDDTAMAIGLAESIVATQTIDEQDLGQTFRRNFEREPWRGYAAGPPTIFSLVSMKGISYFDAAKSLFGGEGSLGNGASMRVGPVGLFFHSSPKLYEFAAASARVTHAHPVGMDGAAVQAYAISQAVSLDPGADFPRRAFIQNLIDFAETPEIKEKMEMVQRLIHENAPPNVAADRIGRTVAIHESMPFAIFSFVRHPEYFVDCLFCAILNGGDRDTLGAMACAVSGAYLGIDSIPKVWENKLENLSHLENLAIALADLSQNHV
jgi:poly(ADP-ribose) glycohydrolase ARH3